MLWLKAIGVLVGMPFLAQLAKNTADTLWTNKKLLWEFVHKAAAAPFRKLMMGASGARAFGGVVVVAVPLLGFGRNAGLELNAADAATVARQIARFAALASDLENVLHLLLHHDEYSVSFQMNSDCSLKVELTDDGSLRVPYRYGYRDRPHESHQSFATIRLDPSAQNNIIESGLP
jgi:hypothetical protein